MSPKRTIALQTTITLLALAVGILIGQRTCTPKDTQKSSTPPEVKIVERLVPSPPEIIYECPPEPPKPKPTTKTVTKPKPASPKKALPPAPSPTDPLERQRLLAWVRNQSADLEPCRDNSKNVYRLTVNLHLNDTGTITRVDLNTDTNPNTASPTTLTCLRNRIATWRPPTELTQNRTHIVFGLTF